MTTTATIVDAVVQYCSRQTRNGSQRTGSTVTEIQLDDHDAGRLDVVGFWVKSGSTWIEGFEVKASRSDFLADVTARKYERYVPLVDAMWFAVAEGVAKAAELPPEIGFMTVRPDGTWRVHRRPKPTHRRENRRQMDRIAVRLAESVPARLARHDELVRVERIMAYAATLPGCERATTSGWWGTWLSKGVRTRIHSVSAAERNAEAVMDRAKFAARQLVQNAERRADAIDAAAGQMALAQPLMKAAAELLNGREWQTAHVLDNAAAAIEKARGGR